MGHPEKQCNVGRDLSHLNTIGTTVNLSVVVPLGKSPLLRRCCSACFGLHPKNMAPFPCCLLSIGSALGLGFGRDVHAPHDFFGRCVHSDELMR